MLWRIVAGTGIGYAVGGSAGGGKKSRAGLHLGDVILTSLILGEVVAHEVEVGQWLMGSQYQDCMGELGV